MAGGAFAADAAGPVEAASATPAAGAPAEASTAYSAKPWAVKLNLYMWLTGVNGNYTAGPLSTTVDKSFIDIVNASHRFPLGFMGRVDASYEDFGAFVDGVWMDLDLKPKSGPRGIGSLQLDSTMGIMDYGVSYRVAGKPDLANWDGASSVNRADLYVGGRTIWLDNTINPERLASVSSSKSFTAPILGGRISVDVGRDFFVRTDGNIGGFGADNVDFTGGILGAFGYRLVDSGAPVAIEAGYKALRVEVSHAGIRSRTTLNGPFLGFTAFW
jgi:hypothetical protein